MKIRKNGKTISLSESDMKRIVNKLLKEESDPKEDLVNCCEKANIKAPAACLSGDYSKCIEEVSKVIMGDPIGEGMKAITALNCLKDKQNSSVQH
jgi:hypothetical protein